LIVHLVLFTPRSDLDEKERTALRETLQHALTKIPSIRNYRVGRRVRLGTAYDQAAPLDFEFLVTIEVDDERALSEYLTHPAHQRLGRLFYEASAHALACDFRLGEMSDLQ
jgi:Stress responsive A/B Barrel Domain